MASMTYAYSFTTQGIAWEGFEKIIGNVSLKVDKGSVLGIVGPSGCGKSSLLGAFAGREKRISSQVSRCKKYVEGKVEDLSKDDCTLMPQNSEDGLLPWYTVSKYWKIVSHSKSKLSESSLEDLASRVGLKQNILNLRPHKLSGGQKRRVLLVGTLLASSEAVFLDEPFVGLDLDVRIKAIDLLKCSLSSNENDALMCGAAIIVSHSIEDIAMLCDTVAIAKKDDNGRLSFDFIQLTNTEIQGEKIQRSSKEISDFERKIREKFCSLN